MVYPPSMRCRWAVVADRGEPNGRKLINAIPAMLEVAMNRYKVGMPDFLNIWDTSWFYG